MAQIDKTYHGLLNDIINEGFLYEDPNRKGVTRIQIPSYQFKHDFKIAEKYICSINGCL